MTLRSPARYCMEVNLPAVYLTLIQSSINLHPSKSLSLILNNNSPNKGKVVFNPLRLGTVIVLVSSGIDFVNTPRLYSDRATR